MPTFKVVRVQDLVDEPAYFQLASTKEAQFARSLKEALNRMASAGWHLPALMAASARAT